MSALGDAADVSARVYFTGGATAVLLGWRESTIDIDLTWRPERDEVFRALPSLKERLQVNVELVGPADFVPAPPGWEERSRHIGREGRLDFFHCDFYAQALSKIERGHAQDLRDVDEMITRRLVEPAELRRLFEAIVPKLHRYPAIDPDAFRRSVDKVFG